MDAARRFRLEMRDADQARAFAQQAFGDIRFDVLASDLPFEWRVQAVDLGAVIILPASVSGKVRLGGTVSGTIVHVIPRGGARAGDHRHEVAIAGGRAGAVYSDGIDGWWQGEGTHSVPTIRFAPDYLRQQLELISGTTVTRDPRFAFELPTTGGPGAMIERVCASLFGELGDGLALPEHPILTASVTELLARALLLGHVHDHSQLLAREPKQVQASVVRQVEDYVRARAGEPIAIAELARLTSTGAQALDAAFVAQRGQSLAAFIRSVRLEHARDALRSDPTLTPLRAAYQAGFAQPERFAAEYFLAFGEQPEQTARQTRARLGPGPREPEGLIVVGRTCSAPTVFVLCADPVRAATLQGWLHAAGHAVELFDSVRGFVQGDHATRPGCVIVDLALADHDALAEQAPTLPRVGLATADLRAAIAAIKAGALDVLDAPAQPELLAAVEAALARDAAQRRVDAERSERAARIATLTPREREVLDAVARGLLNKQIAAELGISEATVRFHRGRGIAKLGVDSVAELVRLLVGA